MTGLLWEGIFHVQDLHKSVTFGCWMLCLPRAYITRNWAKILICRRHTASLKVMKIFSHLQTGDQSQKVQNDKLSRGNVETNIFVGGNGTFSHFLEKKIEKIWKKIFKKNFFFTKICFSDLETAYVQHFV